MTNEEKMKHVVVRHQARKMQAPSKQLLNSRQR